MKKLVITCIFFWCLFFTYNARGHDTGEVLSDETKRLIHQLTIFVLFALEFELVFLMV